MEWSNKKFQGKVNEKIANKNSTFLGSIGKEDWQSEKGTWECILIAKKVVWLFIINIGDKLKNTELAVKSKDF